MQNGEVQRYEIQRCGDTEMGEGAEPPLPIFSSRLLDAERLFCPSIWALSGASAGFSGSFEGF